MTPSKMKELHAELSEKYKILEEISEHKGTSNTRMNIQAESKTTFYRTYASTETSRYTMTSGFAKFLVDRCDQLLDEFQSKILADIEVLKRQLDII